MRCLCWRTHLMICCCSWLTGDCSIEKIAMFIEAHRSIASATTTTITRDNLTIAHLGGIWARWREDPRSGGKASLSPSPEWAAVAPRENSTARSLPPPPRESRAPSLPITSPTWERVGLDGGRSPGFGRGPCAARCFPYINTQYK